MSYPAYPEYRNSGVEWIGKIPKHWQAISLKYLARIVLGKMLTSTDKGKMLLKPYLRAKNIRWLRVDKEDIYEMWFSRDELLQLRLYKDDLLVSEGGEVGRTAIWNNEIDECYIQNSVNRVRVLNGVSQYFLYQFYAAGHLGYFDAVVNRISIAHLTKEKLGDAKFVSAPKLEQTQIATFLDRETQKIDRLIEKQQQLIKLLQEKRQAMISHAVTKGLNPDAKMKDSGVEWLGEIPGHWDVKKTKRIFKLIAEPAPVDNDFELLSVYTEIGVRPRKELEARGNKATTTDGYWLVRKGDIIVNKLLAWMGAVGYSNYEGVTSPAYDILRSIQTINPKFYHYLFRSNLAQTEFKRWSRGIMEMRLRLYFDELGQIFMPLPSIEEQNRIVDFIEEMENKFEKLISRTNSSIELLQERRTALISAAVTGKIDVRSLV